MTTETPTACTLPCAVCATTEVLEVARRDRDGRPLRAVLCRQCGLAWLDPRPTAEQVRHYYEQDYRKDYKGVWQPRPKHVARGARVALHRCRHLRPHLGFAARRVLDLGAGAGEVVFLLRGLGHDAVGLEPNAGYAAFARENLRLPVRQGFFQDQPYAGQTFHVVTLFHVLEHLDVPAGVFRQVRGWLEPGGLLWVEVPSVESVCQAPAHQFHRAHLYYFNHATLRELGRRTGFRPVHHECSPDGANLTVAFRRENDPAREPYAGPDNARQVARILLGHHWGRHLLSPHPYLRPFHRLGQRVWEQWMLARCGEPAAVLQRVLEEGFHRGEVARVAPAPA
ncbi:MAG: class I SAM-dependent methyltransferase [Verrucomicrobiota bacterium]